MSKHFIIRNYMAMVVLSMGLLLMACGDGKDAVSSGDGSINAWPDPTMKSLRSSSLGASIWDHNYEEMKKIIRNLPYDQLNRADQNGRNYLHLALMAGDGLSVIQALVEAGVSPSSYDAHSGLHVLDLALANDDIETLDYLLALPGMTYNSTNGNLYHFAAYTGIDHVLDIVEDRGDMTAEQLEETCSRGVRPLHAAVRGGSVNVVRSLVRMGADVDGRGTYDRTPLMKAVILDKPEVFQALVELGASMEATDDSDLTVDDYVSIFNSD